MYVEVCSGYIIYYLDKQHNNAAIHKTRGPSAQSSGYWVASADSRQCLWSCGISCCSSVAIIENMLYIKNKEPTFFWKLLATVFCRDSKVGGLHHSIVKPLRSCATLRSGLLSCAVALFVVLCGGCHLSRWIFLVPLPSDPCSGFHTCVKLLITHVFFATSLHQ